MVHNKVNRLVDKYVDDEIIEIARSNIKTFDQVNNDISKTEQTYKELKKKGQDIKNRSTAENLTNVNNTLNDFNETLRSNEKLKRNETLKPQSKPQSKPPVPPKENKNKK
jgi:hypothetical protein